MSQGLNDTGSEDDAIEDDNDITIHARPPARKTNKQRRKERLLKKAVKHSQCIYPCLFLLSSRSLCTLYNDIFSSRKSYKRQ